MVGSFMLALALWAGVTAALVAQNPERRYNGTIVAEKRSRNGPVITTNFPDPSIIYAQGAWYAFSTNSGGKHVPVATSSDFVSWTVLSSDALPTVGAWSTGANVWAPDVVVVDDGTFVLYYAAESKANPGFHCVGAATSANVRGPYTPLATALDCSISAGGSIDPHAFHDIDGELYLVWKIDGNNIGHGGSCNNGVAPIVSTPIVIRHLTRAGTAWASGSSTIQLLDRGDLDGPLIEAPTLVRSSEGVYFLFFSSNCYSSQWYDIAYATSTSVLGPYTKGPWLMVTGNPFPELYAPGGADVTKDGLRMVFHADLGTTSATRQMYTANIQLSGHTVII